MNPPTPDLIHFLGRLHPLLVHLPIGFIVLLAALELLSWLPPLRHVANAQRAIMVLAVPAALASVVCGWLLARSGGYDPALLLWHRWTGTGVGVASLLVLFAHWRGRMFAYRLLLFTTLGVLVVASHFGGSLTHGSDYLVRYAPAPLQRLLGSEPAATVARPAAGDPLTQPVYEVKVRPILREYCGACHGPEKAKGGLRLDSYEAMLRGGDSGPALVAGRAADSLKVKRMLLPVDHEDHMPPAGKEQPSADQLALLQWWIDAGAPADKSARDLQVPESIRRLF